MEDDLWLNQDNEEEVTEEQKELLYKRVEELKCFNAALLKENHMFECFVHCQDSQDLQPQGEGEGPGASGGSQLEDGGGGGRQKSRANVSDRFQLLTLEQKLHVAQNVLEETQKDQNNLKLKYQLIQDNYKACMKEAELRRSEITKAKNNFERRLLKSMKDKRLDMIEPEKVLQHIDDKSMVTHLEKFNLKNQALKLHEKKLLQQLQQKKGKEKNEYEEFFHEFDEPRIDKNLQVKISKVRRVLSSHKDKLESVMLESTELSNGIAKRRQMLAEIEERVWHTEEECLKAKALNQSLQQQLRDYQAPDIAEYMHVKDKYKKLRKSIHTWERKVESFEMALKTHTKTWPRQGAAVTPANSAEASTRSGKNQSPVKLPYIAE